MRFIIFSHLFCALVLANHFASGPAGHGTAPAASGIDSEVLMKKIKSVLALPESEARIKELQSLLTFAGFERHTTVLEQNPVDEHKPTKITKGANESWEISGFAGITHISAEGKIYGNKNLLLMGNNQELKKFMQHNAPWYTAGDIQDLPRNKRDEVRDLFIKQLVKLSIIPTLPADARVSMFNDNFKEKGYIELQFFGAPVPLDSYPLRLYPSGDFIHVERALVERQK